MPRLRFPEFRDAGEWQSAPLDDLISTVTPPKKIQTSDYLAEGSFPIIDQGQSEIAGWTNDPDAIVESSWPLIVFGDHTCALKLIRRPFAQGADGIKIISGSGFADTDFLYQFLCFRPVIPEEYKRHFSILKTRVVAYPNRKSGEQQKIADCLASIDELITLGAQKLNALKAHKKGLMQQLFPAEGETLPRLRFPEFRDAVKWEEEKLDDLVHIQDGFAFKSTDFVKSREGATQVVRISEINNKNSNDDKVYVPDAFLELNNLGKYIVDNGDLLLSLTGAAGFNFFFWNGGRAVINQRTAKVTAKKKTNYAITRLLESLVYKKINARGEGQNNNLSKEFLSSVVLLIPKPTEQQKIADCLTTLDDLIAAETRKLDTLKTHKKGLMQQLFPKIGEADA